MNADAPFADVPPGITLMPPGSPEVAEYAAVMDPARAVADPMAFAVDIPCRRQLLGLSLAAFGMMFLGCLIGMAGGWMDVRGEGIERAVAYAGVGFGVVLTLGGALAFLLGHTTVLFDATTCRYHFTVLDRAWVRKQFARDALVDARPVQVTSGGGKHRSTSYSVHLRFTDGRVQTIGSHLQRNQVDWLAALLRTWIDLPQPDASPAAPENNDA